MQLSRLVLPAPLGPMTAWIVPCRTVSPTSSSAVTPPKASFNPDASSRVSPGAQAHCR